MKMKFMQILRAYIVMVFCTVAMVENAFGVCSNGRHPSVQDEYKRSDFVVLAVVTASKDFSAQDDPQGIEKTQYDIKVIRSFKGRHNAKFKINSDNTSSRFTMVVGTKYLLFLKLFQGEGIVDSCGNSGEMSLRKAEINTLSKSPLN